ncbi:MAG: PAS domain S-box protein, partial [Desulfobacterota bacterium]|nr:PAS domain S-box protein [Thermodesulfobacteriota bacterium]
MKVVQEAFRRYWDKSVVHRVIALVTVISLLSLIAQGVLTARVGRNTVNHLIISHNEFLAEQISREIALFFQRLIEIMRLQEAHLFESDANHQAHALVQLRKQFAYTFGEMYLLDDEGKVCLSLTGTLEQAITQGVRRHEPAASMPLDPSVQRALRSKTITISAVQFDSDLRPSPSLFITLPSVMPDGNIQGTFVAEIDLRTLWTRLEGFHQFRGKVSLVDEKGTILASTDARQIGNVRTITASPDAKGDDPNRPDSAERRALSSYSDVGRFVDWTVVVEQDLETSFALSKFIVTTTAGVTLLSVFAVFGLLSWIIRKSLSPVKLLSRAALQSAQQREICHEIQLSSKHSPRLSKDVESLVNSFNEMVRGLKAAQDELRFLNQRLWEDLEGRKDAEKALQESEQRYRQLFEVASVGIAGHSRGRIVFANPAGVKLLGAESESQLAGKAITEIIHPEGLAVSQSRIQRMLAGEPGLYPAEDVYVKLDGTRINVEVMATPLTYKGEPAVQVIVTDITERKKAEQQMSCIQEQLRQSQKMEAVGRLAGGVAHDFNNILTAIIGNAEMALAELGKDSPLVEYVHEIKESGKRAAGLTRQLLAFSRKQVLQPERVNLNKVVTEMDKMLRRLIGEPIELETLLAFDLGFAEADIGELEQVILNLAVNARDAMPGGGTLTLETANVVLGEEYANAHVAVAPGSYVMLCVSDTGVGMSKEVQERLFEPFFTTKEKGKGTGLGLATVYGIVKQSRGNIWVYSEEGKGSAFKIYLPRVGVAEEGQKGKQLQGAAKGGTETILIVEDEERVLRLTRKVLATYGYNVLSAMNGREALEVSRA